MEVKVIVVVVDYIVVIGKVFIVVNDSCGFYIFCCFGIFVSEGIFMLEEGVLVVMVENVVKVKGMFVGFLVVMDEVILILGMYVYESDFFLNKVVY